MNIIEKLTNQMKELLEKGISLAFYAKNSELNSIHLLYSQIVNTNSILNQILNQLNAPKDVIEEKIKKEIERLPKVDNLAKENISLSRELLQSLNNAEALATKNGDSYISVDTWLLANLKEDFIKNTILSVIDKISFEDAIKKTRGDKKLLML